MRKRLLEKSLYLSKEENKLLQEKCKNSNLNQSEYIRNLINNYEPKKFDGSIFEKHNNELIDINDKLESILNVANKYGYLEERKIKYCIEHLESIMKDIQSNLLI